MTDAEDEGLRALHQRRAEQEQKIAALLDAIRELERRNEILEREWAARRAKLSPHQRAIADADLADRDDEDPSPLQ